MLFLLTIVLVPVGILSLVSLLVCAYMGTVPWRCASMSADCVVVLLLLLLHHASSHGLCLCRCACMYVCIYVCVFVCLWMNVLVCLVVCVCVCLLLMGTRTTLQAWMEDGEEDMMYGARGERGASPSGMGMEVDSDEGLCWTVAGGTRLVCHLRCVVLPP